MNSGDEGYLSEETEEQWVDDSESEDSITSEEAERDRERFQSSYGSNVAENLERSWMKDKEDSEYWQTATSKASLEAYRYWCEECPLEVADDPGRFIHLGTPVYKVVRVEELGLVEDEVPTYLHKQTERHMAPWAVTGRDGLFELQRRQINIDYVVKNVSEPHIKDLLRLWYNDQETTVHRGTLTKPEGMTSTQCDQCSVSLEPSEDKPVRYRLLKVGPPETDLLTKTLCDKDQCYHFMWKSLGIGEDEKPQVPTGSKLTYPALERDTNWIRNTNMGFIMPGDGD